MTDIKSAVTRTIGKNLSLRRKKMGLTLRELSSRVGVSLQVLQKYESGHTKVSPESLYKLSLELAVDIPYFFKGVERYIGNTECKQEPMPRMVLCVEPQISGESLIKDILRTYDKTMDFQFVRDNDEVVSYCIAHKQEQEMLFPSIIFLYAQGENYVHTLSWIRRQKNYKYIPIIVVAAKFTLDTVRQCYQLGASGFLPRSVLDEEFKLRYHSVLRYWLNAVTIPEPALA